MYVCVCNAVTEREVGEAIGNGARTRAEVTRACGAGGDCGSCHAMIEDMLEDSGCAGHCGKKTPSVHAERAEQSPKAEPALVAPAALVRGRAA